MSKRIIKITFVTFFTISLNIFHAQETVYLSLDQCISIAQKKSPASKIAIDKYHSSVWDYKAFNAGLLPQLSLDLVAPQYSSSINPIVLDDGTTQFLTQQQALSSLNLSLQQDLVWTGGSFILSTGIQRLDLLGDEDTYVWRSTPFVLQFQQPILQHNTIKWQNKLYDIRYKEAQAVISEDLEAIAIEALKKAGYKVKKPIQLLSSVPA